MLRIALPDITGERLKKGEVKVQRGEVSKVMVMFWGWLLSIRRFTGIYMRRVGFHFPLDSFLGGVWL